MLLLTALSGGCVDTPGNDGLGGIDVWGVPNTNQDVGGNTGGNGNGPSSNGPDGNSGGGPTIVSGITGDDTVPEAPDLDFAMIQNRAIDLELETALIGAQVDLSAPWSLIVSSPPSAGLLSPPSENPQGRLVVRYQPPVNYVGTVQFEYSLYRGSAEVGRGVVSIVVYPEILFSIDSQSELTVNVSAYTLTGVALPAGTYIWHFDNHQESGPVVSHGTRSYRFTSGGAHLVGLTVLLTGLGDPYAAHTARGGELAQVLVTPIIAGYIRNEANQPLAGVRVNASGVGSVLTDSQGRYLLLVPYGWSGHVTPTHPVYWFEPASREYSSLGVDRAGQSFMAVPPVGPVVSGRLYLVDTIGARPPIGNQQLAFEGTGTYTGVDFMTMTTADGRYAVEVPHGWTGVVRSGDRDRMVLLEPRDRWTFGNEFGADAPPITSDQALDLTVYTAPIGVPMPQFGLFETHFSYAGRRYDFNQNGTLEPDEVYPDAGSGPYTHYIDNTHPNATDTNNPYGSPSRPRMTIPTTLAAGTVVEVRGGPYTGGQLIVTADGTVLAPIFVRGPSAEARPEIQKEVIVKGAYVVFENLRLYAKSFSLRPHNGSSIHHAAVRHNEVAGDGVIGSGGQVDIYGQATVFNHDIVVYNNHIHHNGDCEADVENDVHGVSVSAYARNVWVLDNHIHHNGGDAFQVKNNPHHVYVARNHMHDDRENAIDIKLVRDIVVSQNLAYGYEPTCSSEGAAIIVHYNAERVWILANRLHSAQIGLASSGSNPLYIIGNEIRDIAGTGISFWNSGTLHIIDNTIVRAAVGIHGNTGNVAGHLINNIIAQRTGLYDILYETVALGANSDMHNNLVYGGANGLRIHWGGILYQTLLAFQAGSEKGDGCLDTDPKFQDNASDFRLRSDSPAANAGATPGVYETFNALYGLDIHRDLDGVIRPQSGGCDIGAYER